MMIIINYMKLYLYIGQLTGGGEVIINYKTPAVFPYFSILDMHGLATSFFFFFVDDVMFLVRKYLIMVFLIVLTENLTVILFVIWTSFYL